VVLCGSIRLPFLHPATCAAHRARATGSFLPEHSEREVILLVGLEDMSYDQAAAIPVAAREHSVAIAEFPSQADD